MLVFDDVGANEGPLVAEELARRGTAVTYLTSCETVMPWGGHLHRYEVPRILRRRCERVITGGLPEGDTIAELDVDAIVPVTAPVPALELVEALERLALPYTVVGDAPAPRTAMHAFKQGQEAALTL